MESPDSQVPGIDQRTEERRSGMMYRNVVAAVVRALAAETINSAGGCDFEPKVQCAKQKGEIVGKEAAFLTDCWVFGRLHKALSPEQWRALVAKFSTHTERKHAAITEITKQYRSPAPERFRHCAIVTWAMPKLPGVEGKRSTNVLPATWYEMDNWSDDPHPIKTQERWRRDIRKGLESMVDVALTEAQHILEAEGILIADCA
ncbi:putative phage-like protein [Pseudomonas savastanoi pv. phaseolicola]|nr:putative phage-like protein [Pseudomonas savastanoi pv. phaseolicola]